MNLEDVWQRVTGTQPDPPAFLVVATGLLALALVAWRPAWQVLRGVVTLAHEGGHATVAALSGRQLLGVRLHSDTSGLTVSKGRPRGPGMVLTLAAGYVAPSLLGLGGVALLGSGHITALLWSSIVLLGLMLLLIRNAYGIVSVLSTAAVVLVASWYTSPQTQAVFGYLLTWFLLVAAPRPVFELMRRRRRGRAPDSDADQLARLTGVGAGVWIAGFGLATLAAAAAGTGALLPWEGLMDTELIDAVVGG